VTVELMLSLYNIINPILSWKLVMVLFFFKLYLLDVSNITMCVCVFSFFDFWCLYTFLILVCGIENPYIQNDIMFIGAGRVTQVKTTKSGRVQGIR
jgi:hypothetical protein